MSNKKQLKKSVSEEILPSSVLELAPDEIVAAVEFYKQYREIADITEKIDIAMGRKQIYKYTYASTKNSEIDPHAIPPTTDSYNIENRLRPS